MENQKIKKIVKILTFGTSDVQFRKNDLVSNPKFKIYEKEKNQQVLSFTSNDTEIEIKLKKNRNFENSLLVLSPRNDGEKILNYFDDFKDIIEFPLIYPTFENENLENISKIVLVYTDQNDTDFKRRKSWCSCSSIKLCGWHTRC